MPNTPTDTLNEEAVRLEGEGRHDDAAAMLAAAQFLVDHQDDLGVRFVAVPVADHTALVNLVASFDEHRRNHEARYPAALKILDQARVLLDLPARPGGPE